VKELSKLHTESTYHKLYIYYRMAQHLLLNPSLDVGLFVK